MGDLGATPPLTGSMEVVVLLKEAMVIESPADDVVGVVAWKRKVDRESSLLPAS